MLKAAAKEGVKKVKLDRGIIYISSSFGFIYCGVPLFASNISAFKGHSHACHMCALHKCFQNLALFTVFTHVNLPSFDGCLYREKSKKAISTTEKHLD